MSTAVPYGPLVPVDNRRRIRFYLLLSTLLVLGSGLAVFLWQRHTVVELRKMEKLLEADEGVVIQILESDEQLLSGSSRLRDELSDFRRSIDRGYASMRIFENPEGQEIVLLRLSWDEPGLAAASGILDHEDVLEPLLEDLKPKDDELRQVLERLVFRLGAREGPAFQDQPFRLSLSRAEKIWQERIDLIEERDAGTTVESADRQRRSHLKAQIEETQKALLQLPLGDTDARVPLVKELRKKREELASIPVALSYGAQALKSYPLLVIAGEQGEESDLTGILFRIPSSELEENEQIQLYRSWITFLKQDLIEMARKDLEKHNDSWKIEVRRRSTAGSLY